MKENLMTLAQLASTHPPHRTVWVTFERVGFHHWPGAPTHRAYLAHPHRHRFQFKVWIQVWNHDRELEFHDFLEWLQSLYGSDPVNFGERSCEAIGDELYAQIAARYPSREVSIEISEDGENGSFTRYHPSKSGAGHEDLASSD
jgi:hypothetical protein